MRKVNRRAYSMGGADYFGQCRRYLLRRIEQQAALGGHPSTLVDRALDGASVEDMRQQCLKNT